MIAKLSQLRKKVDNPIAFTLLEMVLVLLIIAVLLLLIVPNIADRRVNIEKKGDDALVKTVETQQELYRLDNNGKEGSLAELQSGGYLTKEQVERYQNRPQ
ncbi:hypothetical protein AWM75_02165 [Aerococcus urinaehominis]|uniref:Uncharacterized protein n=1 Tax=Aerococcus urinaehominis TaxID=128944 RepID=A0A0X8FK89_9LACT|nr:competence type IV pilus major pilin ComGC [Aerococcus urinaehominis]AMB98868.1 hypothetical protein AWM75_02165 [Aerococcus urinaehominis]SDM16630.1 competence protein ComGC [Aerococcus urinaehominis]